MKGKIFRSNRGKLSGKHIVFGIVSFVVMIGLVFCFAVAGPILFSKGWSRDFNNAVAALRNGQADAETAVRSAIERAKADAAPPAVLMKMHRDYANCLYAIERYKEGDDQIQQAIEMVKGDPQPKSAEADALTHAYQDMAYSKYKRWLNDSTTWTDDGLEDQKKSQAVAEKAFGRDSEQEVFKAAQLSVMYLDRNEPAKAKELMDRCLKAIEPNKPAQSCAWYVFAIQSKMKALQKDYLGAIDAFLQSRASTKVEREKERALEEFTYGMERDPGPVNADSKIEYKDVVTWFKKGEFAKIDQLADQLLTSKTVDSQGSWKLDYIATRLDDKNEAENHIQQRLFDLKKWIKQNPKSHTARIALASTYCDYAWLARGSGWSNTVSDKGWKLFEERLALAKDALDADPKLKELDPTACSAAITVAVGQGWDKKEVYNMIDDCDKRWPTYIHADQKACSFLLPRWYGEPGEMESFVKAKADRFKGAQGDKAYAQLVAYASSYAQDVFEESSFDWERTKAGFNQIFIDFPSDVKSRMTFLKLALLKGESPDVIKQAFKSLKTAK